MVQLQNMQDQSSVLSWNELYGPVRASANTAVKNYLTKTHVLQPDEYCNDRAELHSRNPWRSTTADTFKSNNAKDIERMTYNPNAQNVTSFVLGSDTTPRLATTVKDFGIGGHDEGLKHEKADDTVHLADFAPHYMTEKRFAKDGSMYQSMQGNMNMLGAAANRSTKSALQQHTDDLRTTHFKLGTDPLSFSTETADSFLTADRRGRRVSANAPRQTAEERYTSSVFRSGDWNVTGRAPTGVSVSTQDFHMMGPMAHGVSTKVSAYHHVLPRVSVADPNSPTKSLREELLQLIDSKFADPRDPTRMNIRKAFAEFDKDCSGYISKENLSAIIKKHRIDTTEQEIDALIFECNPHWKDEKLDYIAFSKYLTGCTTPQQVEGAFQTIQQNSYIPHSAMSVYKQDDQRRTNLVLGSAASPTKSIYYKDFLQAEKTKSIKPPLSLPPMDSKVMAELPTVKSSVSTNMADFVNHSTARRQTEIAQRDAALNKNRHTTKSVVLTCEPKGVKPYSLTEASYLIPPDKYPFLSPHREPRSKWDYYTSEGALLHPPKEPVKTESKESYTSTRARLSPDSHALKKGECEDRITDNRNTHFNLGSSKEPLLTDYKYQFSKKPSLDPSLPAAGVSAPAEQKYSHVYPSESSVDDGRTQFKPNLVDTIIKKNLDRYANPVDPVNVNLRKAFMEQNPNLNGQLPKAKLREAVGVVGMPLDDNTFEELYNRCDRNKNGFIDFYEFLEAATADSILKRGTRPPSDSVMHADYGPMEQRQFTQAQMRVIDVTRKLPYTHSSHLFHMDTTGGTNVSATFHDFANPIRKPKGNLGLTSR